MEPSSPVNQLRLVCANCKREGDADDTQMFKQCASCGKVRYCSRECQLGDWKNHKASCKTATTSSSNSMPNIRAKDFHNLFFCCLKGDLEGIQREIARGVDFNAATNVHVFAAYSKLIVGRFYECTELLLQHGADPNAQDVDGRTPLHVSCEYNCEEFVSLLLRYKANPNIQSKKGLTPLLLTSDLGYDRCVSVLLQQNADPNIINNKDGTSPLQSASENGHDKCVSLLLQHNADPNNFDINTFSPLLVACQNDHDKCVLLLLQHGADPNVASDLNGCSPLLVTSQMGYDKCVSLLLQHNADPNIASHINVGISPLYIACNYGHDKCVSWLLQQSADPNTLNKDGNSSLHVACDEGHDKCVSLLLQAGADVEHISNLGHAALLIACSRGHLKCVALLVEHGADIHFRSDPDLASTLLTSCASNNANLVAYMLSLGVDVNLPDSVGVTPVQCCRSFGHKKCLKLLIEHGADTSTMETPLPAGFLGVITLCFLYTYMHTECFII